MSDQFIEKKELLALKTAPLVAWPTVMLFIGCLSSFGFVTYCTLDGSLPLWTACLLNGLITYFMFSVVHDSAHYAISQIKLFNNFFGHVGMLFFGPLAPLDFARWIHNQHHTHTNDPLKDPDYFAHKFDWLTPLRWTNFDYFYTSFFLRQAGEIRKKFGSRLLIQVGFILSMIFLAGYHGYLIEIFALWLIPTRISSAMFIIMFVYLPHVPFICTAKENRYRASSNRIGQEWLLTPIMTFQNYHLVHHLYPQAPFYRMIRLWKYQLATHLKQKPLLIEALTLSKIKDLVT